MAFLDQHRRGAGGVHGEEIVAAVPGTLFDQPHLEPVFAERKPDKARMRAKRMMKQGQHAAFGILRSYWTGRSGEDAERGGT